MILKSIDNSNNNKSDVDWADIFLLDEFQQCVEFELILELGTLSSSIRSKLKKLIFKILYFSECGFRENGYYFKSLNSNTDLFSEYFSFSYKLRRYRLDVDMYKIDLSHYNSLEIEIESNVKRLENDIKVYSPFARDLRLSELNTIGYYIFPAFIHFTNLTTLFIFYCSIPFAFYCRFSRTLNSLKKLDLHNVIFVLSNTEKFKPERLILGDKLNTLTMVSCKVFKSDLTSKTIKFIFDTSEEKDYVPVKLPLILVPSLRKLTYTDYEVKENCFTEFLSLNPQLTFLDTYSSMLDQSTLDTLKSSISLSDLSLNGSGPSLINWQDFTFPNFQSIKNLEINSVSETSCELINNLIISCKNLKTLKYSLEEYSNQETIMDSFLSKTIPKLAHIDYLSINTSECYTPIPIDLEPFNSINHLNLELFNDALMLLELPRFSNLKKITIDCYGLNLKTEDIKRKFEPYKNWNYKFKNEKLFLNYV